ncbi:hypothetical protein VTO42DRAFT_7977 [Malbranchea cinnamomea]
MEALNRKKKLPSLERQFGHWSRMMDNSSSMRYCGISQSIIFLNCVYIPVKMHREPAIPEPARRQVSQ